MAYSVLLEMGWFLIRTGPRLVTGGLDDTGVLVLRLKAGNWDYTHIWRRFFEFWEALVLVEWMDLGWLDIELAGCLARLVNKTGYMR